MNNKGQTLGGWYEAILFSLLFAVALGLVIVNMNTEWGQSEDPTLGIDSFSSAEDDITELNTDIESIKEGIGDGEFEFTDALLVIKTIGSMLKTLVIGGLNFITGGWVDDVLVGLIGLPEETAVVARILWVTSLILILIAILLRVRT